MSRRASPQGKTAAAVDRATPVNHAWEAIFDSGKQETPSTHFFSSKAPSPRTIKHQLRARRNQGRSDLTLLFVALRPRTWGIARERQCARWVIHPCASSMCRESKGRGGSGSIKKRVSECQCCRERATSTRSAVIYSFIYACGGMYMIICTDHRVCALCRSWFPSAQVASASAVCTLMIWRRD